MAELARDASHEVVTLLRALGLEIRAVSLLSQSNRTVLLLTPSRLVAKVVSRAAHADLEREIAVARHVVSHGGDSVQPALSFHPGPHLGERTATSLWEFVTTAGAPSESEIGPAYLRLRQALASFTGALPDFQLGILRARELAREGGAKALSIGDRGLVETVFAADLERLTRFRWIAEPLHGDPHLGNLRMTRKGVCWMDFEAACRGPLEWDLSAVPSDLSLPHDRALLAVLTRLRHACIVTWCTVKPEPSLADREAVDYHLQALRAESASPD